MARLPRVARILAGLLLAPALALVPAARGEAYAPPGALEDCRIPGVRYEVKCGHLQRLLDPARPAGPRIDVQFVVVPAIARNRMPDPVFLLAGGPGQSAIDVAGDMLPLLARLRNRRDIVFVDQRGTGRSAPLDCPDSAASGPGSGSDPLQVARDAEQCLAGLQKLPYIGARTDLGYFTTTLAMQDLDAVRDALGARQLNLIGVSYGTRAALEYQRQFPAQLRRSVLDGVAPPDMVLPESASPDNQAALDALWLACAADSACRGAFPRLAADWAALKASLPRQAMIEDPLTGSVSQVTVTAAMVMSAVRGPLYSPVLASALPQAITYAAAGRFGPLFALGGLVAARGRTHLATGMHFSVICAEDAPRMALSHPAPGADFGSLSADAYRAVCARWPAGAVPSGFYGLSTAVSPVLLLSGALDPMTPPRHAARVAAALGPTARSVVIPNAGHGIMSLNCISDVVYRFIDAADDRAALAVDAGCALAIPRPLAFIAPRPAAR